MRKTAVTVLALGLAVTGCSGDDEKPPSAGSVAAQIAESVDVEQVEISEDTDPNELLGRPNGYVAAVVLKDPRLEDCGTDLGVDCGATLEEWPDASKAKKRAEYISTLQEGSSMFGSEYHYFAGPVLVRVSGELKPSEAKEYEVALGD